MEKVLACSQVCSLSMPHLNPCGLQFLDLHLADQYIGDDTKLRREFMRKRARARLMLQSDEKTATGREAWAEDHEEYVAACEAEADAVEADEFLRAERNKAETIIACWQTENANRRAGGNFR